MWITKASAAAATGPVACSHPNILHYTSLCMQRFFPYIIMFMCGEFGITNMGTDKISAVFLEKKTS